MAGLKSIRGIQSNLRRLKQCLEEPSLQNDITKCRQLMQVAVGMMTRGTDIQPIFSGVIKMLAHPDAVVKKLASLCLIKYADKQKELVLLGINTLLKDCIDSNPMIRGLAIKTLCSLQQENLMDYAMKPTLNSLQDRSAYVRRAAIMGCVKLHQVNSQMVEDHEFVEILYGLIRDEDPIVVINCLTALEEILESEGGIVMNKNIVNYLLNHLTKFSEWGMVTVLNIMQKYKPKTEEELFNIMDLCDPYLKHTNGAVVCECVRLFLGLVKDIPNLQTEVLKQAATSISGLLNTGNAELSCLLLDFVDQILLHSKDILACSYKVLFCRYNEPLYIKVKKIRLLSNIVTEDNAQEIVDELGMYCTATSQELVGVSIHALGEIARVIPSHFEQCTNKLFLLLKLDQEHVTTEVLKTLRILNLRKLQNLSGYLQELPRDVDTVQNNEGICSLIWLLGHYSDLIDASPYILEQYVDKNEENNQEIKQCLLTSLMRVFFMRPGECQDILGKHLECCVHDKNKCVSDHAVYCYNLLKSDVKLAKGVVCDDANSGFTEIDA